MRKNLFLGMFAVAGMLLATSCSNDDLSGVQSGNEATVRFNLGVENRVQSRAISDGTSADKLVYAVYNADNELITTIAGSENGRLVKENAFPNNGLKDNVTITLAKGQTYTVVFWAQDADCNAYNTDDLTNVTIDYTANNNDETRDAFFKAETFTVTGDAEIDVTLKRPFAQLNVGVYNEDWEAAVASGIEIEKSKVVIKNAATSINLLDGSVSGEQEVEYAFAEIPTEDLRVDLDGDGEKEDYTYLSMSYFLVNPNETADATVVDGASKATLADVQFTFQPKNGNEIVFGAAEGVVNVPVQRNFRTNIIGQLLTGNIKFNIEIDPIYDGEYNGLPFEATAVRIGERYFKTIQAAVTAAEAGDVIEIATGEYKEIVNLHYKKNITLQAAGENVVIAGLDAAATGDEGVQSITVKGITLDNSLAGGNWMTATGPAAPCVGVYGGDFTFEDCIFNVDGGNGKETGVIAYWTSGKANLKFTNCTFNGGTGNPAQARAMQIYGNNGKGVDLTVDGCTFNTAKDYTLKYVGQEGNTATLTNNVVNNSKYFVQTGAAPYAGKNYTVNIKNNQLGEGVAAHFKDHEEGQIVNEEGNVQVIAEGLTKDANGIYHATGDAGLSAVRNLTDENVNVVLESDAKIRIGAVGSEFGGENTKTITIDGNGKTITFNGDNKDWNRINSNAKLIIKNATITNNRNGGVWGLQDVYFGCEVELENVNSKNLAFLKAATLKNVTVTIDENTDSYAMWICANGQAVTIDGLTINASNNAGGRAIAIKDENVPAQGGKVAKVTLNVANAKITSAKKAAILVTSPEGADITLNNVDITNVKADSKNAVWIDEANPNAAVTVTGGTAIAEP